MLRIFVLLTATFASTSSLCYWTNPLFTFPSADPWVTLDNGVYYYVRSNGDNQIFVHKSSRLSVWANSTVKSVWTSPRGTDYSTQIWAPELHQINGKWYIYFTASDAKGFHRMFVIQAKTSDPFGQYEFKGRLVPTDKDYWSIDGTPFQYQSKLYFVWSSWDKPNVNFPQNLYIAEMESPIKLNSSRVMIATPTFYWEKQGMKTPNDHRGLLEGPEALVNPNNGKLFMTYSASGCWSMYYRVGALELTGTNPMNPKHWLHHSKPLLEYSDKTNVYGTGHASYTMSKDGTQNYIVYHAMTQPDAGEPGRTARLQQFHWDNKTGLPVIGTPVALNQIFPTPSGECK